ncbi:MAG: amidohydrolase family protein [Planctomycetota bacterium]
MRSTMVLIDAAAVRDAKSPPGPCESGGESVLVEALPGQAAFGRVLAVGPRHEVYRHERAASASRLDLEGRIVVPAFVNAHTHLDLTIVGPRPFARAGQSGAGSAFVDWVQMVRQERPAEPDGIRAAVSEGARLSRAGGVAVVGDIAGAARGRPSVDAVRAFRETALAGVSCLEFFGIGAREADARSAVEHAIGELGSEPFGLSPHAPNTVSVGNYAWAASLRAGGRAHALIATHVGETPEEREFVEAGTGPQRDLLESLDLWDDRILADVGRGAHPVEHVLRALGSAAGLSVFAHVNDAPDEQIAALARAGVSVAYCPRASDYFGRHHDFGPHRYLDMLGAGVNVALGTDSIINLPEGTDRLSTLDEARFLFQRDGFQHGDTGPRQLLEMITLNGLRALGLDEGAGRLAVGACPVGLVSAGLGADGSADPIKDLFASEADLVLL